MKFLLIMFAPYKTVQMQIAALSATLKKLGCDVSYIEIIIFDGDTFSKYSDAIKEKIESEPVDLVGFSSYDMNYDFIIECSDLIKSLKPDVKIIVGGHSASLAPEDYMKSKSIDFVCIGESEDVLKEFLKVFSGTGTLEGIQGLCSRSGTGQVIYNRTGRCIENLDEIPLIDRSIVALAQSEIDYLPIFAGKGCYFNCAYCANESMKKLYVNAQHYVRFRSPERLIDEIRECRKAYKFKYVFFYDDIFVLNFEWLKDFSRLYKEALSDLPFYCLLHPSMAVDEERIKILSDSGCDTILMGIESGSENYRQKMLKRMMTNEMILRASRLIRKHHMKLTVFLMVGFPKESLLDILKTFWLNLRVAPDGAQTAVYFPIKNTPLYKYCVEHNFINEKRRKRIFVYSYNTCLNFGFLKRSVIIFFKWLNSASPLIRHFRISLIGHFLRIQYRKWVMRRFDYK